MKSMKCIDLWGGCDLILSGNSFEEIAEASQKHCMEMLVKKDSDHLEAMNKMQEIMKSEEDMMKWFEGKRSEFNSLADD